MYIGDYTDDYATMNFTFTTRKDTGLPTVLSGSPVISVYKGSNVTPKTSAQAYITLDIDYNSKVGLNHVLIDLSGDAFFVAGEDYHVVITTGTVNSISVIGEVVATFSIENRFMRGTDNAALASVLGAVADAAVNGDPTVSYSVISYLKQLVNVLVGTTGVTTYPAEQAPANNINLAEVLRAIHADVTGLAGSAMVGTDDAALAESLTTAQTGITAILADTGTDGVKLHATQPSGWANKLAISADLMVLGTVDNSAHTPTAAVFQADDITEATGNHFNGRNVFFYGGSALVNQGTDITDYDLVGANGQFTVTAMTEAAANNDTFIII